MSNPDKFVNIFETEPQPQTIEWDNLRENFKYHVKIIDTKLLKIITHGSGGYYVYECKFIEAPEGQTVDDLVILHFPVKTFNKEVNRQPLSQRDFKIQFSYDIEIVFLKLNKQSIKFLSFKTEINESYLDENKPEE